MLRATLRLLGPMGLGPPSSFRPISFPLSPCVGPWASGCPGPFTRSVFRPFPWPRPGPVGVFMGPEGLSPPVPRVSGLFLRYAPLPSPYPLLLQIHSSHTSHPLVHVGPGDGRLCGSSSEAISDQKRRREGLVDGAADLEYQVALRSKLQADQAMRE